MGIHILEPGALTTVQDGGRTGYQAFGVPVSGVTDPRSAACANLLLGNEEGEAVLEMTLLGPKILFGLPNVIAIAGGDFFPTLDGKPVPRYQAVAVRAGQVLHFAMAASGCRAYLAFAGGLRVPLVMGSRSTYLRGGIGGWYGRALQKHDEILFRHPLPVLPDMEQRRLTPEHFLKESTVRVVLGPQADRFTKRGIQTFLSECYTVAPDSDRMGCRLRGPVIEAVGDSNILSDGISFGAIQVPANGQLIVLLSDRQTTGGYPKIANVITADLPLIAQKKAGDAVRFQAVSVEEAQECYRKEREWYRSLRVSHQI